MAGAGFKSWVDGDILTAGDVNTYLMQQAVMVFADASARSTALTAPSEGMVTYLTGTDVIEYYDGAAWQPILDQDVIEAKGDLIVGTADDTVARLAVGTNGQFLTADSTETTGLKWTTITASDVSCWVYQNAGTSLTQSAWTTIAFAAEDFDTDTMHDNATNNSRITINTAGKYIVGGTSSHGSNAIGGIRILLNGSTVLASSVGGNSGLVEYKSAAVLYDFSATDYIQLQAYTGGAGQSTAGDATVNFWAVKVN